MKMKLIVLLSLGWLASFSCLASTTLTINIQNNTSKNFTFNTFFCKNATSTPSSVPAKQLTQFELKSDGIGQFLPCAMILANHALQMSTTSGSLSTIEANCSGFSCHASRGSNTANFAIN